MAKKVKPAKRKVFPYLSAAVLCEHVLEEKDGAMSAIRIFDRVNLPPLAFSPPGREAVTVEELMEREGIPIPLWAFIAFKSGDAKGRYVLKLVVENPAGEKKEVGVMPLEFQGAEHGVNVRLQLMLSLKREGLYWFDVRVDGRRFTRVPLRIAIQREPSPPESLAAE